MKWKRSKKAQQEAKSSKEETDKKPNHTPGTASNCNTTKCAHVPTPTIRSKQESVRSSNSQQSGTLHQIVQLAQMARQCDVPSETLYRPYVS